jgi:hypothetical protein
MPINYERAAKLYPQQKAALTRAVKSGDAIKIKAACTKAVRQWNECGAWPDHWSRWQRALDDAQRYHQPLEDL